MGADEVTVDAAADGTPTPLPSVFLSYARADDEAFVGRLHAELVGSGCAAWWDRVAMPSRVLTFVQEIRDAIDAHDRLLLVVGPAALRSDYVTAEWRYALEAGKLVLPLLRSLDDAKRIEDELPRELRRVHVVDARARRPWEETIAEIMRHLRESEPPLALPYHVPELPPHYRPRPDVSFRIEEALALDAPEKILAAAGERIVVVHGMGGVGKSVATSSVARAIDTRRLFPGGVVWVNLGREPDVVEGLRRIGRALADDLRDYASVEDAVPRLMERIGSAPLLVVADNAWNDDDLVPFQKILGPAMRLVVTSRDGGIATRFGALPVEVDVLTDGEAMRHLADWVGLAPDALPAEARDVAAECDRLPLAISLVGAMARDGTGWSDLAAALREADLSFIATRLPDYPYENLLRSLQVSVDALRESDELRDAADRYVELAPFRWDDGVPEEAIVTLWTAGGRLDARRARRTVTVLASKALLRAEGTSPNRRLLLHDLLYDFVRASNDDLRAAHAALLSAYEERYPAAPFIDDDGYYLAHVAYHLEQAGQTHALHGMLRAETAERANRWWETRSAHGQVAGYVDDLRRGWVDAERRWEAPQRRSEAVSSVARYALMIGSVRSAVGAVPSELVRLFLEHGMWTPAQALAAADWAESARSRFDTLLAVLPFADTSGRETIVSEAVALALREPEAQDQTRRFLDLAEALGEAGTPHLEAALARLGDVPPSLGTYEAVRAWSLRRDRLDLLDEALAGLGTLDEFSLYLRVLDLAPVVPPPYVSRIRKLVEQLNPSHRAEVLVALARRQDVEDWPAVLAEARVAVLAIAEAGDRAPLLAHLAPLLSDEDRLQAAHDAFTSLPRVLSQLTALLNVLPFLGAAERAEAERAALELVVGNASAHVADALTGEAGQRLASLEPTFFHTVVEAALDSVSNADPFARAQRLPRLLRLVEPEEAARIVRDEARRVLLVDDVEERAKCLAALALRLCEEERTALAGRTIDRLLERLAPEKLPRALTALVPVADSEHLRVIDVAVETADRRSEFAFSAAMAAGWANQGLWDEALAALGRLSPYETGLALDQLAEAPPVEIARAIVWGAYDTSDPDLYWTVAVRLAPHLPDEEQPVAVERVLDAADALDNAHDRCRLLEQVAPLLPCDLLARAATLIPDEDWQLARAAALRALVRAHLRCGDFDAATEAMGRLRYLHESSRALLDAVDALPNARAELLDAVEARVREVDGLWRVEILVELARRVEEPRRSQLLGEAAAYARDGSNFTALVESGEPHARALMRVAAEAGDTREPLLLAAWDATPKGGAFSGVAVLAELGPHLAKLPPEVLFATWADSLRRASRSRRSVLEELAALADVVAALGGRDAVADVVAAVEDVDRWWP